MLIQVGTMFVTRGRVGIQVVPCFFASPRSFSMGFLFAPPQISDFLTRSCNSSAPIFSTVASIGVFLDLHTAFFLFLVAIGISLKYSVKAFDWQTFKTSPYLPTTMILLLHRRSILIWYLQVYLYTTTCTSLK